MSAEQPDSGRASDVPTPTRREKKRVVWDSSSGGNPDRINVGVDATTSSSSGSGSGGSGGSNNSNSNRRSEGIIDLSTLSPSASPTIQQQLGYVSFGGTGGELDANELTRKLTKVMHQVKEEEEEGEDSGSGSGNNQHSQWASDAPQQQPGASSASASAPKRPRPALRRNTSYDAPREQEEADEAEKKADRRTLQSISKAKERAEMLALQLGSHSAPGSRRNSSEGLRGAVVSAFQRGSQGGIVDETHSRRDTPGRGRSMTHLRPSLLIEDYDEMDTDEERGEASSSSRRARRAREAASDRGGVGSDVGVTRPAAAAAAAFAANGASAASAASASAAAASSSSTSAARGIHPPPIIQQQHIRQRRSHHRRHHSEASDDESSPRLVDYGHTDDFDDDFDLDLDDDSNSRQAQEHYTLAARLVKSHLRKSRKPSSSGGGRSSRHRRNASGSSTVKDYFIPRPPRSGASGYSTPVIQQEYVQDYVPRPTKYRGGVLASLLALYQNNDDRSGGPGGSGSGGRGTPSSTAPATPIFSRSPRSASPAGGAPSRAGTGITTPGGGGMAPYGLSGGVGAGGGGGSGAGTPRSRPSSGLFSLHRSARNSTSSLALTELIKSSGMIAAPGSSGLSGNMADHIRREQQQSISNSAHHASKPKKEQIKITVHIAAILSRHRYLLKLCRALMMYGAPTHRLEEYLIMSARVLEIDGQFLYIPSCMIISFDDSATHTTEVKIVRVPQGVDLGRLRDVHEIYKNVVHDRMGVEEATRLLDEVMEREPKFSVWFRVFLYGVASVCVGPFAFKMRFMDFPPAFLLGCLLGIMQLVFAPSNELYAHVFEVSASVVTSFLARGFGSIRGGELFCFSALAQSSIALILPGYMVLCSSLELQSHNIVAGSVRMVHAMIYTLFLGYGITIGASLYGMLDSNAVSDTTCADPLHRNWYFLFVPGFTLCLCLVNQSKWRQTPVMIFMALAGFCVNSYTSDYFKQGNTQISNMLGALTIGILANLYSRLGRHFENKWYDLVDFWHYKVRPRLSRIGRRRTGRRGAGAGAAARSRGEYPIPLDTESRPGSPVVDDEKPAPPPAPSRRATVGYSLAAAAMLPAIFVQVPSGLAANGSLLAGINSANEITRQNGSTTASSTDSFSSPTPFNVLLLVIQVAISISVGLFMSALIVYPLGKRRSGLFSF